MDQPWFINPVDESRKVYVLADVPHLMKLIRNHFVDDGFYVDGNMLTKSILEELIEKAGSSDLRITFKISKEMLNVRKADRQKVKYATKLFSRTVAAALARAASLGEIGSPNAAACSELFELVCRGSISSNLL